MSKSEEKQSKSRLDFESQYQGLVECVTKLESGQLSLDDALSAYQKGIGLVQNCRTTLNQAQARVEQILSIDAQGAPLTTPLNLDVETPDALKPQKKSSRSSSDEFF